MQALEGGTRSDLLRASPSVPAPICNGATSPPTSPLPFFSLLSSSLLSSPRLSTPLVSLSAIARVCLFVRMRVWLLWTRVMGMLRVA